MKEIDDLFQRVDNDPNVDGIRLDIADLIARCLEEKRKSLGYWEKNLFNHAIGMLRDNIRTGDRESRTWLKSSLVSVRDAFVPGDKRNENYTTRRSEVEDLTFDDLMLEVRKLGGSSYRIG